MNSELVDFLRARVGDDRSTVESVNSPVFSRPSYQVGVGGGSTALVPLGRFKVHLDAIEATLNKYETAWGHVLRAREMGWEHGVSQAAAVAYLDVIKLHALEYADHPGYKEAWRL